MISQRISNYRILSKLGAGGMGEVYLAEDTKLNRKVAVKFVAGESTGDELAGRSEAEGDAKTGSLLTEAGARVGTVPYMSPEQVRGEALDARSDIFSFGTVLYEMVSGHHPFVAESVAVTVSALLTREPTLLARYSRETPAELERIVTKALAKDREERYQSIKDMLIDLKRLSRELEFESRLERSAEQDTKERARIPSSEEQKVIKRALKKQPVQFLGKGVVGVNAKTEIPAHRPSETAGCAPGSSQSYKLIRFRKSE